MTGIDLQRLRRTIAAVERLRGEGVREVTVRSDLRQLRVELTSGRILVISAERDAQDRPHLEVDVVEVPAEQPERVQLEAGIG